MHFFGVGVLENTSLAIELFYKKKLHAVGKVLVQGLHTVQYSLSAQGRFQTCFFYTGKQSQ